MRFRVNGLPAPQGSKRHVGGGRMVESSRAVGPWREAVRAEAQRVTGGRLWVPFEGTALSATLVFIFARPKSHYGTGRNAGQVKASSPAYPAAKRNDIDKLARATLDGLVDGGLLANDGQVVSLNCAKVWAAGGEAPGAVIEVEAM